MRLAFGLCLLSSILTAELVGRLDVSTITTNEVFGRNTEYQFRYIREYPSGVQETWPIYTDTDPTGTVRIAWTAKSRNVHVTTLTSSGERIGDDLVLPTSQANPIRYVRGLACTDDGGFALLVVWPHSGEEHSQGMVWFMLFDSDGTELTRKVIDRRSKDFKLGDGVLKYGGPANGFQAYLKITGKNPGSAHDGDTLLHINQFGEEQDPIWNWGCSHPQMNELVYNPTLQEFGAFCTSDTYPAVGLIFNRHAVLRETNGDSGGHVGGGLGDVVPTETGYLLSFIAPRENRPDSFLNDRMDVGLMHVLPNGQVSWTKWITNTPEAHEHSVHLAAYEDGYLIAWAFIPAGKVPYRAAGNQLYIAKVDANGDLVGAPEEVTGLVDWQERPNFVTLPNGAVAWTSGFGWRTHEDGTVTAQQGYYQDRNALQFVTIRPEKRAPVTSRPSEPEGILTTKACREICEASAPNVDDDNIPVTAREKKVICRTVCGCVTGKLPSTCSCDDLPNESDAKKCSQLELCTWADSWWTDSTQDTSKVCNTVCAESLSKSDEKLSSKALKRTCKRVCAEVNVEVDQNAEESLFVVRDKKKIKKNNCGCKRVDTVCRDTCKTVITAVHNVPAQQHCKVACTASGPQPKKKHNLNKRQHKQLCAAVCSASTINTPGACCKTGDGRCNSYLSWASLLVTV
eukprot:TRINITY_DN13152_c0_g1_i1.p1 TRINITY_DN13152_c0_g1~~TRINITY_DN13152_c0_g1_i1.p1  ORF type:complete len:683 (+),score=11.98 TRINITY_DN13152_c0_g1_i1:57-2105(+)